MLCTTFRMTTGDVAHLFWFLEEETPAYHVVTEAAAFTSWRNTDNYLCFLVTMTFNKTTET